MSDTLTVWRVCLFPAWFCGTIQWKHSFCIVMMHFPFVLVHCNAPANLASLMLICHILSLNFDSATSNLIFFFLLLYLQNCGRHRSQSLHVFSSYLQICMRTTTPPGWQLTVDVYVTIWEWRRAVLQLFFFLSRKVLLLVHKNSISQKRDGKRWEFKRRYFDVVFHAKLSFCCL